MHPKHKVGLKIEQNALPGEESGVILFPGGQVIIDGETMRNGRKYDIETMVLDEYAGQVTADHWDSLETIVGKVINCRREGNAIVIDGIQFAMNSASGRLAHDLMAQGFLTDMSVETYGPWPDESDDTYYKAKLIGLSVVVVGNSKSARVKQLVLNSLAKAKADGLDTTAAQAAVGIAEPEPEDKPEAAPAHQAAEEPHKQEPTHVKFKTYKNGRDFAVPVTYKNAAGETVELELAAGATFDASEDQSEAIEKQINSAAAPKPDLTEAINEAVKAAIGPLQKELKDLQEKEQNAFDAMASEPGFVKAVHAATKNGLTDPNSEYGSMDWRERHGLQVSLGWDAVKNKSPEAAQKLRQLNEFNLGKLKEEGVVRNSLTIEDFGNFVISRELMTEIQGKRNNYTPLIEATTWTETVSTQMAWLERSGDINMQPVAFGPTDALPNGNLKPISEYGAVIKTADLEELAAVTPVANAATRFLAADLLGDVAQGYRTDYDRKRAQLVIARLEQAVEGNGQSVNYATTSNTNAMKTFLEAWRRIANTTPNGTFVFNTSTYAEIVGNALSAGVQGPLSQLFSSGDQQKLFGRPYVVVSDDLMPTLNSAGTKTIAVNGTNVTVNHGVFYADLSNFTGRISGGLQYDLSTDAAYEEGGVTKSAFQRNELVLRGSFFRGGAIKDSSQVAGILSPGVS